MKRMREPSEMKSKKKTLKLGETSETIPLVPLNSSASSKSVLSETPLNSNLKQLSSSLSQPSSTYTNSEPITSTPTPSEPHNSNPSSPPFNYLISLSQHFLFLRPYFWMNPSHLPLQLPHHHLTMTCPLNLTRQKPFILHLQHWPNSKTPHYLTNPHLHHKPQFLPHVNIQQNHNLNLKQYHHLNLPLNLHLNPLLHKPLTLTLKSPSPHQKPFIHHLHPNQPFLPWKS